MKARGAGPRRGGPRRGGPRRGGLRLVALAALVAGAALWGWRALAPVDEPVRTEPAPEAVAEVSPDATAPASAAPDPAATVPEPVPEPAAAPLVALAARVLDHLGRPVSRASAAVVAADGALLVDARTDSGGLLLLRPRRIDLTGGEVLIIVDGDAVHWRPAPTASDWLGDLALSSPAAIVGELYLPDGTPAADVELRARLALLEGDGTGLATAGLRALVPEPQAPRTARTDPLGRFALEGLTPGDHLLEARLAGEGDWARLWISSHRASLVPAREVPRRERVAIEALLLTVAATDGSGAPFNGGVATVAGIGPDGDRFTVDVDLDSDLGDGTALVPAARELHVTAMGAGGLIAERVVDLGDDPTGALRVDLATEALAGAARILPVAVAPDGATPPAAVGLWRVLPDGALEALGVNASEAGWLGPFAPGRYRLRLEAAGDRDERHPQLELPFAPAELEFDLAAGEARRLEVPLWRGQRLALTLRDAESSIGSSARGRVEVLEPTGWRRVSFYDVESGRRLTVPEPGRVARSWRPLAPGATRLFIDLEGREPIELELGTALDGDLAVELDLR